MSPIMIVYGDKLGQTPKGFQDFVHEHFAEMIVLEKKCYVAEMFSSEPETGYVKGMAPFHSSDLENFQEGLPKGQSLIDWMIAAEGRFLWTFERMGDSSVSSFLEV